MKKIRFMVAFFICATLLFAACTTAPPAPAAPAAAEAPAAQEAPAAPEAAEPDNEADEIAETAGPRELSIAIVTTSGVDDGSFGQAAYEGILAYIALNPNASVMAITEPDMGRVVDAAAQIMPGYDVVVLPGFQFAPIGDAAAMNPNTKILLIDVVPRNADGDEVELDNVYSMLFKEQESGFFAGVAAALETRTGRVASAHGIAFPSNVNYQFGFASGVNFANAHFGTSAELIEIPAYAGTNVMGENVGGNYIGAFADRATGRVVGEALIREGVDIIFVAAGDSGNGVFAAVMEADGVFVIGCDVDQFDDGVVGDRNIVLTSALKNMGVNITYQLNKIEAGTFAGGNVLLGADTGSTGIVTAPGRHQMSADTLARLQEVEQLLMDGTIVPASNFTDFTPDNFPGL